MKELEEILLGGMFRPTEQNCPTREGELIGSLDKIHDIPNPRVGMRVYVENTGKEYVIKSLKDKTIGGVNVPNAAVDRFEEAVTFSPYLLEKLYKSISRNLAEFQRDDSCVELVCWDDENKKHFVALIEGANEEFAGVMTAEDKKKLDSLTKKVTWTSSSNMNDFKTPGVYDIYGERTRQDDNLPILNASSGHSIAARLTVVASTLQPANNEICVTQFLMLSNRRGGDGNMYVRTYNENNSPAADWWTPWQKLQGIREGYIFTDSVQVNPDGGVQQITGVTGLNNMIDNGIYSGIYTDDPTFQAPTFIDTFTLIVINNYAVASKDSGLKRTISQLKYAVDAITNQASVKQRTKTDGDDKWSDWTEIGGGGSQEVDITDAVKAYGLPTLINQGFAKEGVTYIAKLPANAINTKLDIEGKIQSHVLQNGDGGGDDVGFVIKVRDHPTIGLVVEINAVLTNEKFYKYVYYFNSGKIQVSADMTTL